MRTRPLFATLRITFRLVVSVSIVGFASAQDAGVTIFENVRVLTMTDTGRLERQTVIVRGDRIASLPRSLNEVPSGARVVDASGMTLLPGLADMHAHYDEPEVGPLFLANGVTTVRQPLGMPHSFTGDALAKAGLLAGPHIYASGPIINGGDVSRNGFLSVSSPDEARGAVAAQAAAGFRAVKLYHALDPETFAAAVAAAHERKMQVWAHTPWAMSYDDLLALGVDSLEHLWLAQYSLMDARPDPALAVARGVWGWDLVQEARMPELAAKTAQAGLWNVPTLTGYTPSRQYAANAEEFFRRPEVSYLPPKLIRYWRVIGSSSNTAVENADARRGRERWVKALYDAGAGLLVGTDTPNPFIVPGYSFHEEMQNLSRAGIPNHALLRMATIEAARFLDEEGEFGVIAVGARADLIVVEGDPLSDLGVLRRPAYVMLNGHLWDRAALQRKLDILASRATTLPR